MKNDLTVLCYLKNNDQYLLMLRHKKENDLNEGKWIGIGGHIEEGEAKEQALVREVKEETGLDIVSYTYRGEILFINDDYQEIMYLYTADKFEGDLIPCKEGELQWIDIDDVLKVPHWEGDEYFLKKILENSPYFEMSLIYSKDRLIEVKESI